MTAPKMNAMERLLFLSAKSEPSELTVLDIDAFETAVADRVKADFIAWLRRTATELETGANA